MALLTQTTPPEQTAQMTQDPAAGGLPVEQGQPTEGQVQGLSFTTEQLVDSFKESMDEEQTKDMGMIIDEGKQLMFGPESHEQIMGMLEGSQDIGTDLGNGAQGEGSNSAVGHLAVARRADPCRDQEPPAPLHGQDKEPNGAIQVQDEKRHQGK